MAKPYHTIRLGRTLWAYDDVMGWIKVATKAAELGEPFLVKTEQVDGATIETWETPTLHESGVWRTSIESTDPWSVEAWQMSPMTPDGALVRGLVETLQTLLENISDPVARAHLQAAALTVTSIFNRLNNFCERHHGPVHFDQLHDVEIAGRTVRMCTYCKQQQQQHEAEHAG